MTNRPNAIDTLLTDGEQPYGGAWIMGKWTTTVAYDSLYGFGANCTQIDTFVGE